jgi:5-methylcytosine-specific restriction endonuclease McrA
MAGPPPRLYTPVAGGRPGAVQRSSAVVIGKRKVNAPRKASMKKKHLSERQLAKHFGSVVSSSSEAPKQPDCKGGPSKSLKGKVWNGSSRKTWTEEASALVDGVTMCAVEGCTNVATAIDHITPYREYIPDHAPPIVICDGACHFLGVFNDDADEYYSALDNLQPLCTPCNSSKASKDKSSPYNVNDALTPAGACPNWPNGCGGGDCNANVCL